MQTADAQEQKPWKLEQGAALMRWRVRHERAERKAHAWASWNRHVAELQAQDWDARIAALAPGEPLYLPDECGHPLAGQVVCGEARGGLA